SNVCDNTETPAVCEPAGECGNSVLDAGEGWDDGNNTNGDGCDAACLVEDTYGCSLDSDCVSNVCDNTETPAVCEPAGECGNSVLDAGEACDDGNTTNGDGCDAACLVEDTFGCSLDSDCVSNVCDNTETPAVCEPAGECGNSVLDAGE